MKPIAYPATFYCTVNWYFTRILYIDNYIKQVKWCIKSVYILISKIALGNLFDYMPIMGFIVLKGIFHHFSTVLWG